MDSFTYGTFVKLEGSRAFMATPERQAKKTT